MNDNSPLKRGMPGKLVPFVAVIFRRIIVIGGRACTQAREHATLQTACTINNNLLFIYVWPKCRAVSVIKLIYNRLVVDWHPMDNDYTTL